MNTIEVEEQFGIPFCKRQPVSFERGAGTTVWDESGQDYLDFTSGWGVTSLGHCHPAVQAALQQQASQLTQNPNSGFTYSPVRARLLARLAPLLPAPLRRLYFVNSGAEANDVAIKMARKLTGRSRVITTLGAFHGRTLNTLAVSGSSAAAARYRPHMPDNAFVAFGDIEALQRTINRHTAAVIVEPLQGEGGVRIPPDDYLAAVSELCQQHGALLIVDEIQTGMGRTGSLFAFEQCRGMVRPDMMTLGKGLASGFPFAALAMSEACAAGVERGDHGGTYCGNPLGCAVALAVLETMLKDDLPGNAATRGQQLETTLLALQASNPGLIQQVRGRGLLWALQVDEALVDSIANACRQHGLLIIPTRTAVLRLLPALSVTAAEIATAMSRLAAALSSVRVGEIALDCCAQYPTD